MKVCIYGAGAIGGTYGARLAQAGMEVSLVARGAHLAAIRERGLILEYENERQVFRISASDNAADLGPQEVVIIALKAHSLPAAAEGIAPLLGPDTLVVTAMNGVPWWFFNDWGGKFTGTRLKACDPDGRIGRAIAHERVIGGVVYVAADVPEPGVVRQNSAGRLVLGEPSHRASSRLSALIANLGRMSIRVIESDNIRREMWMKLLGNVCFNPVSVLTGVSTDKMLADPYLERQFGAMMAEAIALGNALGLGLTIRPDERLAQTRTLGAIKTSMLQDVQAGRPIELDGIVGATVEIAERLGVAMPAIDAVYGAVRVRAAMLGLYRPQ